MPLPSVQTFVVSQLVVGEKADHNMDCMPVCGQHMRIFPRVLCQQAAIVRSVKDPNEVILVAKTEKQRLAHGVPRFGW